MIELKKLKKESDFKHLNLYSLSYTDRNRTEKNWVFASRTERPAALNPGDIVPDAVVIVPWHTTLRRLVVIREFRVPLGRYQYGFPAGLVDKGERIVRAAERELREETGLVLDRVIKTSPAVFTSSGMSDESVSMVYAECSGEASLEWNEASEDIEVVLLDQAGARKILEDTETCFDVKSWIVVSQFADRGQI